MKTFFCRTKTALRTGKMYSKEFNINTGNLCNRSRHVFVTESRVIKPT